MCVMDLTEQYDQCAEEFSRLSDGEDNSYSRKIFYSHLGFITPGMKVLDVGCGDGVLLELLIKNKGCHGTGVEIDEKAI